MLKTTDPFVRYSFCCGYQYTPDTWIFEILDRHQLNEKQSDNWDKLGYSKIMWAVGKVSLTLRGYYYFEVTDMLELVKPLNGSKKFLKPYTLWNFCLNLVISMQSYDFICFISHAGLQTWWIDYDH